MRAIQKLEQLVVLLMVISACNGGHPIDAVDAGEDARLDGHTNGDAASGCTKGAWTAEPLDYYAADQATALAIDPTGGLHVAAISAHLDGMMFGIWYLYRTPAGIWSGELIEPSFGDNIQFISIGVDPQAGVHIVYPISSSIHYAYRPAGGVWQASILDASRAHAPALAIESSGAVAVVWERDGDLMYVRRTAPAAFTAAAKIDDSPLLSFNTPTLGVDGADGLHVIYNGIIGLVEGSRVLKHAYRTSGGAWSTENLKTGLMVYAEDTIGANDAAGNLHLVTFARAPQGGPDEIRYQLKPVGGTLQAQETIMQLQGGSKLAIVVHGTAVHVTALGPEYAVSPLDRVTDIVYAHRDSTASWQVDPTPYRSSLDAFRPRATAFAVGGSGDVHLLLGYLFDGTTSYPPLRHGYICL